MEDMKRLKEGATKDNIYEYISISFQKEVSVLIGFRGDNFI